MNRTNTLEQLNRVGFPEEEKRICIELELKVQHMPADNELQKPQRAAEYYRCQMYMQIGLRKEAENRESIYEDHFFTSGNRPIQIREQVVYGVQRDFSIE